MSDNTYIDGLIFKPPHERAPSYVIGKVSIKREEVIASLQAMEGDWISLEIKVAQSGKWHAPIDTWQPNQGGGGGGSRGGAPQRERPAPATKQAPTGDFSDDDIPFVRWGDA